MRKILVAVITTALFASLASAQVLTAPPATPSTPLSRLWLGADGEVYAGVGRSFVALANRGGGPSNTLSLSAIPPLPDLTYAGTINPSAVRFGAGNSISFCPALSCVYTPGGSSTSSTAFFDHQRGSGLFTSTTQDDGHSEEQTLAVTTTINKGFHKTYAAGTTYNIGDNVVISPNAVYRACPPGAATPSACPGGFTSTSAGTTASPGAMSGSTYGSRPTTAPFFVTDGTVTWMWVNDGQIDSKVGFYDETNVVNGAGAAWGAAFNYHFSATPQFGLFLPGVEFDYSNDSGQPCNIGVTDCTAIRVGLAGSQVTEGLQVTGNPAGAANYSTIWAFRVNGDMIASQSAIEVDAAAPIGLGFGSSGLGGGSHSVATIQDTSTSPASLDIAGVHSLAAIYDTSTSQNGLSLSGTYAGAQIVGKGFVLDPSGNLRAASFAAGTSAGVSCSGAPTSSYAVTGGIVTHC